MNPSTHSSTRRHPWLAVFLSLVMPGLGQLYCGAILKCLVLAGAVTSAGLLGLAASLLGSQSNGKLLVCFQAIALLLYAFGMFDALRTARRTRIDYQLKDYNRWYVYGLFYLAVSGGHLFLGLYVRDNFLMAFRAGSPSMYPQIWPGDQVMGEAKDAYRDRDPALGEIVIFHNPEQRSHLILKRVVALGGDTIEMRDGEIYRNDVKLRREEAPAPAHPRDLPAGTCFYEWNGDARYRIFLTTSGDERRRNFPRTVVPEHACFVLGDNRDDSFDSRSFGSIPIVGMVGNARFLYSSIHRFGRLQ
jgi:signal peptidase I